MEGFTWGEDERSRGGSGGRDKGEMVEEVEVTMVDVVQMTIVDVEVMVVDMVGVTRVSVIEVEVAGVTSKSWQYRLLLNNTNSNAILPNIVQLQYNTIQCNMFKYCLQYIPIQIKLMYNVVQMVKKLCRNHYM